MPPEKSEPTHHTLISTMRPSTSPPEIWRIPTATGSLKRRGPALPGLKYRHTGAPFHGWAMGVTGNDHVQPFDHGIDRELFYVVQQVDVDAQ